MPLRRPLPNRRDLLVGSLAATAGGVAFAGRQTVPAAGGRSLRVGLVGCGARGVGAALQAVRCDADVAIAALGDLFPDQADEAAADVTAATRDRQAPPRRFHGCDAWQRVLEADVDAVILATPPWLRPMQAAAAVAAGLHVYCERPAGVDAAGAWRVLVAAEEAHRRGLCFAGGLRFRHHAATAEAVASIQAGSIGRPHLAVCTATLGLPWRRGDRPEWTAAEARLRNWIGDPTMSGGPFVERHVDALDRALWALGDEPPLEAIPLARGTDGGRVELRLRDGRRILASIERGEAAAGSGEEAVIGSSGRMELPRFLGSQAAREADPWRTCMTRFIEAIRSGRPGEGGTALCVATLSAVMARTALAEGRPVSWAALEAVRHGASGTIGAAVDGRG